MPFGATNEEGAGLTESEHKKLVSTYFHDTLTLEKKAKVDFGTLRASKIGSLHL